MKKVEFIPVWYAILLLIFSSCQVSKIQKLKTGAIKPMPQQWIDEDTDYRLTRLTELDGDNRSFYFHNNPFIPTTDSSGYLMVYYHSSNNRQSDRWFKGGDVRNLYVMNLKTKSRKQLTNFTRPIFGEMVNVKKRKAYFQSSDTIYSVNIDNGVVKKEFVCPDTIQRAGVTSVNVTGDMLVGVYSMAEKDSILKNNPKKSDFFRLIYEAKLPHNLFVIDLNDSVMKVVHSDTAWINHVQFSTTDPNQIMFCHEGPWHKVDRIWSLHLSDQKPELVHKRTVYREIAGHEFFSTDGRTIWFDLQIPRGETFYLAGYNIDSKEEIRYAMKRDEWSIHFNISHDQKFFVGDGGDEKQVAKAKDGKWLYKFTPNGDSLKSEKLVNMELHDYDLEPNVHITPDGEQVIFRANFEGSTQVYAVDL